MVAVGRFIVGKARVAVDARQRPVGPVSMPGSIFSTTGESASTVARLGPRTLFKYHSRLS